MAIVLVADIGGTNSRFELLQFDGDNMIIVKAEAFLTHDYKNFVQIITTFLNDRQEHPTIGVFAVAGVVRGSHARFVNTNWEPEEGVEASEIQEATGIEKIVFLNDFVAAGYGVQELGPDMLIELNQGVNPSENAPKAVVGPGTGLGECYMTWNGQVYDVWGTEGGHSDYAPKTELQWKYASYMMQLVQKEDGEYRQFRGMVGVSNELCIAGVGAHHLYYFLKGEFPELVNPDFDQEFEKEPKDRLKLIMEYGFSGRDQICDKAVKIWQEGLAHEIGNVIARTLCYGGIYVMGGLVTKNVESLAQSTLFIQSIYSKPPHINDIIRNVPIYLVKHLDVGMLGTKRYAKNILSFK